MPKPPPYNRSVFINCPFDTQYGPIFEALVFTIHSLGFVPRCSKEVEDGDVRITRIIKIINECRFGVHDISRTELDKKTRLPRFNMPLELGIDMGCKHGGHPPHRRKSQLVMDKTQYRYRKFISDISGSDIKAHSNSPGKAIRYVRDWLRTGSGIEDLPSADFVISEYRVFRRDLPKIYKELNFKKEVPYSDYSAIVFKWLKKRKSIATTPST